MQKQNKAKVMPMNAAFSGLLYKSTGSFRSTDNEVFQGIWVLTLHLSL